MRAQKRIWRSLNSTTTAAKSANPQTAGSSNGRFETSKPKHQAAEISKPKKPLKPTPRSFQLRFSLTYIQTSAALPVSQLNNNRQSLKSPESFLKHPHLRHFRRQWLFHLTYRRHCSSHSNCLHRSPDSAYFTARRVLRGHRLKAKPTKCP